LDADSANSLKTSSLTDPSLTIYATRLTILGNLVAYLVALPKE
jgi:hypothetical protein